MNVRFVLLASLLTGVVMFAQASDALAFGCHRHGSAYVGYAPAAGCCGSAVTYNYAPAVGCCGSAVTHRRAYSYAPAASLDETSLRQRERALAAELEDASTQEERDRVRKELARVTDERRLRIAGIPRPPRALVRRPLLVFRERLSQAEARLRALENPAAPLEPPETRRTAKGLEALLGPCARCHVRPFAEAAPARRQLHAMFRHRPHVSEVDCTHCHVTVERSSTSMPGAPMARAVPPEASTWTT